VKRLFLFVLFNLWCIFAIGQDFVRDSSSLYYIRLKNKTEFLAEIISRNFKELIIHDKIKGEVNLTQSQIVTIELAGKNYLWLIETVDNRFFGEVVYKNNQEIMLNTENMGQMAIPLISVKSTRIIKSEWIHNGTYWGPNPNASRLLFSATAIPLKKGESFYELTDVLIHQYRYGVTDNFSVLGGSILPFSAFVSARYAQKVKPKLYMGGGAIVNFSFYRNLKELDLAFVNGLATYGNESSNITVGVGMTFFRSAVIGRASSGIAITNSGLPITLLGAQVRLAKRISLVTENYFFSRLTNTGTNIRQRESVLSGAMRIQGERKSFEFGLLLNLTLNENIVIPHIGYTYYFGRR